MSDEPIRKGAWTGSLSTALYKELATNVGNLFFSPYSIGSALVICQAGASGATRQELEAVLKRTGAGDRLAEELGELQRVLANRVRPAPRPFELSLANALWRQKGYSVDSRFVERLRDQLGAEMKETDFSGAPAEAVRDVNSWVSGVTRGKIREILFPSQIDPTTRAILTNAIFFKAPWLHPFEESGTRAAPFHLLDGRTVEVAMMHHVTYRRYARADRFRLLELPYGNDWVVMLVVLPDEGRLADVERRFDAGALLEQARKAQHVEVALALPRFRVESSLALGEALRRAGVGRAFSTEADLAAISREPGFSIQDLLHKAVVDVDEHGTEAAAATAMIVLGAALGRPNPIEFRVDRPFLFLIADKPTGAILFLGRVVDPSAQESVVTTARSAIERS